MQIYVKFELGFGTAFFVGSVSTVHAIYYRCIIEEFKTSKTSFSNKIFLSRKKYTLQTFFNLCQTVTVMGGGAGKKKLTERRRKCTEKTQTDADI